MRMISQYSLANIFVTNTFLDALHPGEVADYEIFGFPEFDASVADLRSDQKQVLESIVSKIASSQSTRSPIVALLVVGHADKARTKPLEQRATFEQVISEMRATSATKLILDSVKKRTNEEVVMRIRHRARGEGSKFLFNRDNPNKLPTNAEMERNRRVEIFLVIAHFPDPPMRDPNDKREVRIDRALRLLSEKGLPGGTPAHRIKRAPCFLNRLKKPNVVDVFVDGKAISKNGVGRFRIIANEGGRACFLAEWNGNYDTAQNPLPQEEVNKFLNNAIPILDGPGFSPQQSDDQIMNILAEVLLLIDLGINQVDLYVQKNGMMNDRDLNIGYAGDAIRKRLQKLYRDHLDDDNNIYSCWA